MDRSSILRASTINATTWENSQVVLFCQQNRQGESNSACIARVTKRASGAFRRARARRADASKPRGCAQRIRWFDSPRLHHQFRASLTRGSFASRAENRRSQNQLRAKNNSHFSNGFSYGRKMLPPQRPGPHGFQWCCQCGTREYCPPQWENGWRYLEDTCSAGRRKDRCKQPCTARHN